MSSQNKVPNVVSSILKNQCPHCRASSMFTSSNPYKLSKTLDMHDNCPNCGGDLQKEPGFYYGTGYVSYGLSIAIIVAWFVCYWFTLGISIYDNSLFYFLGSAVAIVLFLQPVMMRLSRTIWISIFERYKGNKNGTLVN